MNDELVGHVVTAYLSIGWAIVGAISLFGAIFFPISTDNLFRLCLTGAYVVSLSAMCVTLIVGRYRGVVSQPRVKGALSVLQVTSFCGLLWSFLIFGAISNMPTGSKEEGFYFNIYLKSTIKFFFS